MGKKGKKYKPIDINDIDEVRIIEIRSKEYPRVTEDIVMEFPDQYGTRRFSFMKAGLTNAIPGLKEAEDSTPNVPKVAIEFMGLLEIRYE